MKHFFAHAALEDAADSLRKARREITEYIADNEEDHESRYQALFHMTRAIEEAEKAASLIESDAEKEAELLAEDMAPAEEGNE